MSTKAEWAELFESVHGRKPSPQEFLDAKAADFDTSALTAQAASVEAPANEPVATEEVTEQDDIADVAETAEDAVAEQASSESPVGAEAFSEACLKRHLSLQLKDLEQFLIQQLAQQINLFSILSCQSLRLHFQ